MDKSMTLGPDPIGRLIENTPKDVLEQESRIIQDSGGLGQSERYKAIIKTINEIKEAYAGGLR